MDIYTQLSWTKYKTNKQINKNSPFFVQNTNTHYRPSHKIAQPCFPLEKLTPPAQPSGSSLFVPPTALDRLPNIAKSRQQSNFLLYGPRINKPCKKTTLYTRIPFSSQSSPRQENTHTHYYTVNGICIISVTFSPHALSSPHEFPPHVRPRFSAPLSFEKKNKSPLRNPVYGR